VVPLIDENVRLLEVLALANGISNDAKANNIRVLRGEDVFLIDLSTIEGFRTSNLIMQPGDIVYVEPIRRPFSEALRDYAGILSIVATLTTLIVVITSTN
jgi:polysaccharide export outer membrane protein